MGPVLTIAVKQCSVGRLSALRKSYRRSTEENQVLLLAASSTLNGLVCALGFAADKFTVLLPVDRQKRNRAELDRESNPSR